MTAETSSITSREGSSFRRLWVLMVTAFVDMIGFALILPLLPLYATRFGATPLTVGFLMAIFALSQLVTAPLWGRFSDHRGRRPVIIAGLCLASLAFLAFGFANSVWLLFVCRLVQGAGAGTISVIQAYVSDVVEPKERAAAFGWITAASSAGVMIGPAIGSFSVGLSHAAPGLIASGLCALNAVFAWRWLKESSVRDTSKSAKQRPPLLPAIGAVVAKPLETAHMLVWVYAVAMMAFMAMNGIMALYLADQFGITEHTIGYFYVAVGMVSVVVRALILGRAVRRFGEVRVLRMGALMLATGMALAPFAANAYTFLAATLLVPIGTAFLFPSTTSLVSRFADPETLGQTLGVQQAFGGVSRLLGPIWATAVFQYVGQQETFWLGSVLVALVALGTLRLHPGQRAQARVGS